MRRDEGGMGQERRPFAPEPDQVVAVGAIAVEEHHELLRRAAGGGRQARSVESSGAVMNVPNLVMLPACPRPPDFVVGGVGIELAVILHADVVQQVELRLEIIDMAFLVARAAPRTDPC